MLLVNSINDLLNPKVILTVNAIKRKYLVLWNKDNINFKENIIEITFFLNTVGDKQMCSESNSCSPSPGDIWQISIQFLMPVRLWIML